MYTLGIDIGASSVKLAAVVCGTGTGAPIANGAEGAARADSLLYRAMRLHKGDPLRCLSGMLGAMAEDLPACECAGWAVTGSGAGMVRERVPQAQALADVPAVTQGAALLAPKARSIIEIGGQQALFVTGIGEGRAPRFGTNDSCAAGTGSFFEDQMQRLGLEIEDYSRIIEGAESVPRLSGRCSVFAKTDIIHRQQEGVPTRDILLGLCYAMVRSYKALIVRSLPVEKPLALSGGVLLNAGVVRAVREVFKLEEGDLLADERNLYFQAAGAALYAEEALAKPEGSRGRAAVLSDTDAATAVGTGRELGGAAAIGVRPSLSALAEALTAAGAAVRLPRNEPLPQVSYEPGPGYQTLPEPWPTDEAGKTPCALGIDVGSTSTDLVLLDQKGRLLDAQYLRTAGNPKAAVARGLKSLGNRLGDKVAVKAVATTGSGRSMIGDYVGADVVRDEITAQARGAAAADPAVDTVFEIGGQDSKYISLKDGQVADFQMNKICAAGTGSFVEEQASRLGIPLADFGALALSAKHPVDLGERCTVFVETAINAALAKGARKEDVAAGLCQSIIRNYLHRVVGNKPVGSHIVLQGGVNYNPGIVAAFKQEYGEAATVSPWFAVSGAVGAALLAWDADVPQTAFKGFDLSGTATRTSTVNAGEVRRARAFFHRSEELMLEGYTGAIDPAKKTVGVPRCLMIYKFFPMANAFFTHLGFNVVISDISSEETLRLSQQTAQGETCLPVKLMHGHMLELVERGVDYIFMPSVQTIKHAHSTLAHNYACPYMNAAPRLVAGELGLEARGIKLISPVLDLDFGQQAMATAMLGVGEALGCDPHETARALLAGSYAVNEFTRKTEEAGQALLDSLGEGDRVMVIVTRNYGISDAVLNSGIPDALIDRGQKVITMSHLRAHDFSIGADYPNVYWPFGQHILSAVKLIRRDPRLFMVYLTNHGCGPDTMLSHLVAEEMGGKPYLQIEVDEHFSKVGVITRIEAFLNSIEHYTAPDERTLPLSVKTIDQNVRALDPALPVAVPSFGLAGRAIAGALRARGFDVREQHATAGAIARGKRFSTTKEYLSFSAELGCALEACEAARAEGEHVQLLLPSSEGADADGQYDRVIKSVLDAEGFADVPVVAPRLEELPARLDNAAFGRLCDALLAADVAQAAGPGDGARDAVFDGLAAAGFAFGATLNAARAIGVAAERGEADAGAFAAPAGYGSETAAGPDGRRTASQSARKRVLVVGEWPVAWDDVLTGGALLRLEERGVQVKRMPSSEFFWFLWRDAARAARTAGAKASSGAADLHASTASLLEGLAGKMAQVHRALGAASPFAADPYALERTADSLVGKLHADNARYRIAKTQLAGADDTADGVLAVASMYENSDIILQLEEASARMPLPVMHVTFDGTMDASIDEKIDSFTYYLRPGSLAAQMEPSGEEGAVPAHSAGEQLFVAGADEGTDGSAVSACRPSEVTAV